MSNLSGRGQLTGIMRSGGGAGGTTNYNDLTNKPKINNMELVGNKTTSDLNISYEDLSNKPTIRNVPETTGAEIGSVLTHTENGEVWNPVPKELPSVASGSNGNVLTINNGSIIWAPVSGGGSVEYSTSEKEVGLWIDGKKLYEKTFIWNETINGDVAKSISLDNPDYVFIYGGSGINSGNAYIPLPYPHYNEANIIGLFISSDKNSIGFRLGSSAGLTKAIITIRYTKVGE